MSILIKGMEMPKNCHQCFYFASGCKCNKHNNGRPSDCPLIELPPHGRLIDADALIKQMTEEGWADGCGWADALDLALGPTIIEASDKDINVPIKEGE